MKIILGGINGNYLRNFLLSTEKQVEEVVAAVAYATDTTLLFDWCWKNQIPLRFYGRLDEKIAVSLPVLKSFLDRKSPNYVCRLVERHHAKVIWWRGLGLYIGSANMTQSAWNSNAEAGCFFAENEITDDIAGDIEKLFSTLHSSSTPLTDELYKVMRLREHELEKKRIDASAFWKEPSITRWGGLVWTTPKAANEARRDIFLTEWHATLQEIRDIGAVVSKKENRPKWIPDGIPVGAQADQFLGAYYYQKTFDHGRADYQRHYERNKQDRKAALIKAVDWWRGLENAPMGEDEMLLTSAPVLRNALSSDALANMDLVAFHGICARVHAIIDYSRRVNNATVKLTGDRAYTIPEKISALSSHVWSCRTGNGSRVNQQLHYILYSGSQDEVSLRLWNAVTDPKWKMECLGISALGEIVGWALPDTFPPRNGRTSKALRSLGYEVMVHV